MPLTFSAGKWSGTLTQTTLVAGATYTYTVVDNLGGKALTQSLVNPMITDAPASFLPANGATVTATPTFSWNANAVNTPTSYGVQISNNGWQGYTFATNLTYTGPALTAGTTYSALITAEYNYPSRLGIMNHATFSPSQSFTYQAAGLPVNPYGTAGLPVNPYGTAGLPVNPYGTAGLPVNPYGTVPAITQISGTITNNSVALGTLSVAVYDRYTNVTTANISIVGNSYTVNGLANVGLNYVVLFIDQNGNGVWDQNVEPGAPKPVQVVAGQTQANINLAIEKYDARGTTRCWNNGAMNTYDIDFRLNENGVAASNVSITGGQLVAPLAFTYDAYASRWYGTPAVTAPKANTVYTFKVTDAKGVLKYPVTTSTFSNKCITSAALNKQPVDGSTVIGTPTFTWNRIAGADYYVVELFNGAGGPSIWSAQGLSGTSVVYNGPALVPGSAYSFTVTAGFTPTNGTLEHQARTAGNQFIYQAAGLPVNPYGTAGLPVNPYGTAGLPVNPYGTAGLPVNPYGTAPTLGSYIKAGKSIAYLDSFTNGGTGVTNYNIGYSSMSPTNQFVQKNTSWDPVTNSFKASAVQGNTRFLLNGKGWLLVDDTKDTIVDNGAAGIVSTHNNGTTTTHQLLTSTAVGGLNISQALPKQWPNMRDITNWALAIDPYAVFSANAQKLVLSSTENNDVYSVSIRTGCPTPLGFTKNCQVANYQDYAIAGGGSVNPQQLGQIFSINGSKLVGIGDGTLPLYKDLYFSDAGNGNQGYSVSLMSNTVNDSYGQARIYAPTGQYGAYDWSNIDPYTRNPALKTPAFITTWNRITAFGQTMVVVKLPAAFPLPQWTGAVTKIGFTVQDTFVRQFTFIPKGAVQTDANLNDAAAADVQANFIGPVGSAQRALSGQAEFMFMNVDIDPYAGSQQSASIFLVLGVDVPNLVNNTVNDNELLTFANGVPDITNSGVANINFTLSNQLQMGASGKLTFEFSKDGEFAVGEDIGVNGSNSTRLKLLVKRSMVAPTLASVAGSYRLVLLAHDSTLAPAQALPGYTENGTLTLDGFGGSTYVATNTDITTGVPVFTPINGVSTYTVDAYGAVLGNTGNGHLILSSNGQYGLYELHATGTQEWGIVIKQHKVTIPFSAMTSGTVYDVHDQGADLHKALDVRKLTPTFSAGSNVQMLSIKAFAPTQLTPPAIICGTPGIAATPAVAATATTPAIAATLPIAATATCVGRDYLLTYAPVPTNTTKAAVNGEFTLLPTQAVGQIPPFKSYISQDGGVFWTDDGEAGSIIIGITR